MGTRYVTVDAIRMEMKLLPDRVTDEMINTYIKRAGAIIDAYVGQRYVLPIRPPYTTPDMLEAIALDITVFLLYQALYTSNAPNMDEYQERRYDIALKRLDDIRNGKLNIPLLPLESQKDAYYGSTTMHMDNIFSYEDPEW